MGQEAALCRAVSGFPGGIMSDNGGRARGTLCKLANTEQDVNLFTQYSLQWLSEGQVGFFFLSFGGVCVFFKHEVIKCKYTQTETNKSTVLLLTLPDQNQLIHGESERANEKPDNF